MGRLYLLPPTRLYIGCMFARPAHFGVRSALGAVAYIVMAYVIMADLVFAHVVMPHIVMA